MKKIMAILAAVAALALPQLAQADKVAYYGISASDHGSYIYLGGVLPIRGSTLDTNGWRVKGWLSAQEFDYDRTGLTDVDADGTGAQLSIGYQWIKPKTRLVAYIGVAHRSVDTSPKDLLSKAEGSSTGVKVAGELSHQFNKANLQFLINHVDGNGFNDTWARARVGFKIKQGKYNIGPEITTMDGPDYRINRLGVFIDGFKFGKNTYAGVSLGAHDSSRSGSGSYASLGFSTRF